MHCHRKPKRQLAKQKDQFLRRLWKGTRLPVCSSTPCFRERPPQQKKEQPSSSSNEMCIQCKDTNVQIHSRRLCRYFNIWIPVILFPFDAAIKVSGNVRGMTPFAVMRQNFFSNASKLERAEESPKSQGLTTRRSFSTAYTQKNPKTLTKTAPWWQRKKCQNISMTFFLPRTNLLSRTIRTKKKTALRTRMKHMKVSNLKSDVRPHTLEKMASCRPWSRIVNLLVSGIRKTVLLEPASTARGRPQLWELVDALAVGTDSTTVLIWLKLHQKLHGHGIVGQSNYSARWWRHLMPQII